METNTNHNSKDKLTALISFLLTSSPLDEEWKELQIGNGNYFVSSQGRVLSLYNYTPIVLKPYKCNDYFYVKIEGKNRRINRLVAKAFLQNDDDLPIAHHIDGNKLNNKLSNIQWTSYSNNTKEYYRLKREKENQGF